MKLIIVILAVCLVFAGVVVFIFLGTYPQGEQAEQSTDDPLVIGLSLGTLRSERWVKDRDYFVARAEELGAHVLVLAANEDPDNQVRQAENLILQGVDVLVVVAEDGEQASGIVDKAHEAGIKVIAYDRLIKNPALDYYVSFDNIKVGEHQAQNILNVMPKGKYAYVGGSPTDNNAFLVKEGAMNILQPAIDAGDIEIVFDEFSDNWKQEVAHENMRKFFSDGGTVDAVVAANDSTAAGVIHALQEVGLAGTVPVSGQDASLAAIQNILAGTQTVTVYKPIKSLAYKAAEMAVTLVRNEEVKTNSTIANGTGATPSYLLDVVDVTIKNIEETVIRDGFHDRVEVYKTQQ